MGELTDFLVWLNRQHKAGKIPVQTVQVVGYEVMKFIQEMDDETGFGPRVEKLIDIHGSEGQTQ